MDKGTQAVSIRGKQQILPAITVCDVKLVIRGKIFKVANIHDEIWLEAKTLPDRLAIIEKLKSMKKRPDIFSFAQRMPDVTVRYPYHYEWENVAAAKIESYQDWFENEVDRSVRKNIRKSQKEGIVAQIATFDDQMVQGICSIYNELEVRQGRQFWHYGKSFDEVKQENGTHLDRSIFIGAYLGEELVGFIKIIVDGEVATMMQILSKACHFAKRPTNALISKTVEICESKGMKYLIYGEYTYGKKDESSLIDFKRKNGFRKIEFPRYYVPLTAKGQLAVKLGLYKGWRNLMPSRITKSLVHLRSNYYAWRGNKAREVKDAEQT